MKEWFAAFDTFPTTRLRICASIGLIIATGITYLAHACFSLPHGWEPTTAWTTFLLIIAGIDTVQYTAKGMIDVQNAKINAPAPIVTHQPSTNKETKVVING